MITADPNSVLGHWCKLVDRMEPGQFLRIDINDLCEINSFKHNGATFTPADRILGNIIGSGYTHSFELGPMGRHVTFRRHKDTGERTYHSPDATIMPV